MAPARVKACSSGRWEKGWLKIPAPIVRTKLNIPRNPPGLVPRPQLVSRLQELVSSHRLTLISAPPGYGKTTSLTEWARSTGSSVAWISLSSDEDSLESFLRYIHAAWERVDPQVAESNFGVLLASQGSAVPDLLAAFLNLANQLKTDLVVVLDDFHLIESPEVLEGLAYWIDNLPPPLHFVISTRSQPDLPLHRYRARGQVAEIGSQDLRFDQREAAEFLHSRMGLDLPYDELQELQTELEGWAAGLQLAALGSGGTSIDPARHSSVTGRQRYLAEYLSRDVLDRLPTELQDFMLSTSILDRLSASLCEALTGRADSQAILGQLERENLFLQALDNQRHWFRYHNLFGDYLQGELEARHPERLPDLHRRASLWLAEHGQPETAFKHALQSGDSTLVLELADRHIPIKISRGELKLVDGWLRSIPAEWFERHPMLVLGRAAYSAMTGDFQAAMTDMKSVEHSLEHAESREAAQLRARLSAFYCATACMQNDVDAAQSFGSRASQTLPEEDVFYHGLINGSLGDTYRAIGRWDEAERHYHRALAHSKDTPLHFMGIHAYGGLADLSLQRGDLRAAADHWRQAISISQEPDSWGAVPLPVVGWAYVRLAEILYEWNDLDQAAELLEKGLERSELGGDVRAMIAGHVLHAKLAVAGREFDSARQHLDRAGNLLQESDFPDWTARFERVRLDYWLAQENTAEARVWVDRQLDSDRQESPPESPAVLLGAARALLQVGSQSTTEQAQDLLARIKTNARDHGRDGELLQCLALEAIALWQQRDKAGALSTLTQALRLAETQGYTRTLIDLGLPFARLVQEARSRDVRPEQVERLLAVLEDEFDESTTGPPLTEPLTERELEVLQLLAAGLTNREIGEELVISPGTVKKHTANIYGKLNVGSRTAAAARARELSLL